MSTQAELVLEEGIT